jgi:signal recognition particle subunit SRP54
MGNIGQLASMIPGLNSNLITKDKEKESTAKIQRFLTAMDSMTKEELDGIKTLDESRIKRISRGSGVHVAEIHFLLAEHKKFGSLVKGIGGMLPGMMGGMGGANMENVSLF